MSNGRVGGRSGRAIAFTVMPGPQLVSAVPLSKALKRAFPHMPIIWGGNFGSLYPAPVLNAPYVDWLVRGQGEDTFLELLEAIDGKRDPLTVAGHRFPRGRRLAPARARNGCGGAPASCPRRPITRSTSASICTRRSWDAARASTRRRSAARTAAISAA